MGTYLFSISPPALLLQVQMGCNFSPLTLRTCLHLTGGSVPRQFATERAKAIHMFRLLPGESHLPLKASHLTPCFALTHGAARGEVHQAPFVIALVTHSLTHVVSQCSRTQCSMPFKIAILLSLVRGQREAGECCL